jgi:hypothetical protein
MPCTLPWDLSTPHTPSQAPLLIAEAPGLPPFAPEYRVPFFPYIQPSMEPSDYIQWDTSFTTDTTHSTDEVSEEEFEPDPPSPRLETPTLGPSGFNRANRVSHKTRIEIHALSQLANCSPRELAKLFSLSRSTI